MTLQSLFQSYGWQLGIIGFIGTLIVGWLKKPVRALVVKKSADNNVEKNFDTVAFVLGFLVATLFGSLYTLIASKSGWLYDFTAEGEKVAVTATFLVYFSNICGAWGYQVIYYQIWKKFGLKRLLGFIWNSIKKRLDKNNDGVIDFDEATSILTSFIGSGKLTLNDILSAVASVAPAILEEVTEVITDEAGDDGKFDIQADLGRLGTLAEDIIDCIPEDKVSAVLEAILKKLEEEMKKAAENPAPVPDSAALPSTNETDNSATAISLSVSPEPVVPAKEIPSSPQKPKVRFN